MVNAYLQVPEYMSKQSEMERVTIIQRLHIILSYSSYPRIYNRLSYIAITLK